MIRYRQTNDIHAQGAALLDTSPEVTRAPIDSPVQFVATHAPAPRKRRSPVRWDRRRFALKIRLHRTSGWRLLVQGAFLATTLALGWQFVRFVHAARTTTTGPLPMRPPGVEGFLPISGLMGLVDAFHQGALNTIHPAATVLFVLFVGLSLLLRKAFCGWICPVGFVSENLARLGRLLFKRNLHLPRWLDIPLRGLKYLLLGFFAWAIFSMTPAALHAFIASPYNKVADVKMLDFFVHLSMAGVWVVGVLALLSVVVEGFWCRYLCPYGALMGLVSWMSPVKIRRDPHLCTDCAVCDKVCPARLPVMSRKKVTSVECVGCTDCVTSCPVPGALWTGTRHRRLDPKRLAAAIVLLFVVGTLAARAAGWWKNDLTPEEIRFHVARMNTAAYGHPGMNHGE